MNLRSRVRRKSAGQKVARTFDRLWRASGGAWEPRTGLICGPGRPIGAARTSRRRRRAARRHGKIARRSLGVCDASGPGQKDAAGPGAGPAAFWSHLGGASRETCREGEEVEMGCRCEGAAGGTDDSVNAVRSLAATTGCPRAVVAACLACGDAVERRMMRSRDRSGPAAGVARAGRLAPAAGPTVGPNPRKASSRLRARLRTPEGVFSFRGSPPARRARGRSARAVRGA
jgi:hypothetical protein